MPCDTMPRYSVLCCKHAVLPAMLLFFYALTRCALPYVAGHCFLGVPCSSQIVTNRTTGIRAGTLAHPCVRGLVYVLCYAVLYRALSLP